MLIALTITCLIISLALVLVAAIGAWRRYRSLRTAWDAAQALSDAHNQALADRSARLARASEQVAERAAMVRTRTEQAAASIGVLATLAGEIPRTRTQAQWAFLRMLLGRGAA